MKTFLSKVLIFLFAVVFAHSTSAQQQLNYDSLDLYIQEAADLFDMPGIAVGIVKDNEVVFEKAYGYRNTDNKTPVNVHTQFAIASCTKAFTAACAAILVDQGEMDWDDRVADLYPEFQMYDPCITSDMRVDDLLCHRSGLQTFDGDLLWYGTYYNRDEVVRRIRFRENTYGFRSHFGYQNVMFIAAGQLIGKVSGMTWDEFIKKNIFEPLEMNETNTSISDLDFSGNVAWPHIDGKPTDFINYDNAGPAASINTSVDDLLKWVKFLLNKGMIDSTEIFSPKQYYTMVSPHTMLNAGKAETLGDAHFYGYGLGWFLFDYEGRKIIQHGGGVPGFHSKVVLIPEEHAGYVILADQISGMVEAIYKRILDFYLSDNPKDWAQIYFDAEQRRDRQKEDYMEEKREARVKDTKPSLDLKEYTGTYEDKMYGKAEISLKNEELTVVLLPTKALFTATLHHWHYDTFNFSFRDPYLPEGFLTFNIDQDAQPAYFTIELKNPDFHFNKLKFEKIGE